MMAFDPVVIMIGHAIPAYVFLLAGLHKLQDIDGFQTTLDNYQVMPGVFVLPLTYIIPLLEIVTGVGLLVPAVGFPALFSAAVLLLVYSGAIAVNLIRGRHNIDCGCHGPLQKQTLSVWLLVRNGALLGILLCAGSSATSRSIIWLDWFTIVAAVTAGCLFYAMVNRLLMNRDKLSLLRR